MYTAACNIRIELPRLPIPHELYRALTYARTVANQFGRHQIDLELCWDDPIAECEESTSFNVRATASDEELDIIAKKTVSHYEPHE